MHGDLVVVDDVPGEFAERVIEAFHGRPNDAFSLAVSGGDTARACYERLADDAGTQIDWWKVDVYWGDERCVPARLAGVELPPGPGGAARAGRRGQRQLPDVLRRGRRSLPAPPRRARAPRRRPPRPGRRRPHGLALPRLDGARRRPGPAGRDERGSERAQPAPTHDAHLRRHRARPAGARHGHRRGEARGAGPRRRRRSRLPRQPRARATGSSGSPIERPPARHRGTDPGRR